MDYTAVYQQQKTGHVVHQNSTTAAIDSFSWREMFRWMAAAIQSHLSPRLRKKYSYNSTVLFCKYDLFFSENYIYEQEESGTSCCNTACSGPLWW